MKKIVAFFISLFVVFSLSNVLYAAPSSVRQVDPTMNVSASSSLRTTATVLADVNLTDVSVTEKDGLYTGQFSLQGKMGMQSDITYGVVVRNSNNAIIEAVKVGEEKVLYEGEIKRYSLIYALPTYFNGEITVNIEAYTKDGLRLGSQKIITKKMNGKGSTLSCVSQVSAIACTSKNNTEMKISLLASGPLGQEILSKVLTFKEGEKVDITKLVAVTSPGNYYISLENQITRERKIIPYNVKGDFAVIQNIAVSKNKDGSVKAVGYVVGSFTKGQVVISVVNSQGKKEINDVRVQLTGRIFIAEFPALSNKGALTASIFSVSNPLKAIAVKTVNYSTVSQINGIEKNKTGIINDKNESNPVPNKTNMNILKILTLFGVLILLLILSIKKSGFLRGGAMIIFITAGMSIGSHNVNALNWYVSTLGGPGCGACEVAHICEGNLQSDKSSYAPGQVMTLTSDLNVTRDVGATDSDKAACSLGYESTGFDVPISGGSPTIVSVNSVSVNELGQPGGIYTTTNSKTFTAPASNGSHYLSVRALLGSETPSGNTWNSSINIQQFTFTVSTVPSVTLFFSKAKEAVKSMFL